MKMKVNTHIENNEIKSTVINIDTLVDKCFVSMDGTIINKDEISKRIIDVLNNI